MWCDGGDMVITSFSRVVTKVWKMIFVFKVLIFRWVRVVCCLTCLININKPLRGKCMYNVNVCIYIYYTCFCVLIIYDIWYLLCGWLHVLYIYISYTYVDIKHAHTRGSSYQSSSWIGRDYQQSKAVYESVLADLSVKKGWRAVDSVDLRGWKEQLF